jgi:hypothetical protein
MGVAGVLVLQYAAQALNVLGILVINMVRFLGVGAVLACGVGRLCSGCFHGVLRTPPKPVRNRCAPAACAATNKTLPSPPGAGLVKPLADPL